MTEKGTIVIVSNTHWHSAWQTGNSVAAGFAGRDYRVLFVEPIPKRWPRLTELQRVAGRLTANSRKAGFANQVIPKGVTLISPVTLPDVGHLGQGLNRWFFVTRVASALKKQLATSGPLILIHTLPIKAAISLQRELKPDVSIYRCVYDWSRDPHSGRQLAEAELLHKVDLAWADCEHNLHRLQTVRPDAILMPPAVDLSLFTAVSYTHSGQPKPVCVYFGTTGSSLDLDLLRKISHRYTLCLIGPVRQPLEDFASETKITGPVPHEQIPSLIRDADILLLPYNAKPHIRGVVPAKLFECLITGKPIVATNLSTIDHYQEVVYLCNGHNEVFEAIEAAQNEPKSLKAERIALAKENSWDLRLDKMEQYIQAFLAARTTKDAKK